MRASEEAEAAKAKAEEIARGAVKDAQEAKEQVDRLEKQGADMIVSINGAIAAVDQAQSEADRAGAKAKLAALQREQAEMQQRIAEAKAKAARAERLKGVKISAECQANPLAKGCN